MEGLIKGLVNVAMGLEDDDRDNHRDHSNSDSRDERSRSSWAQVVSGEQENDGEDQWNKKDEWRQGRNDDEWESSGSRPYRQSQETQHMGYERDERRKVDDYSHSHKKQQGEEENNDGWETVGKKPPRQHEQVRTDQWDNYKRPSSEQSYSDDISYGSNIEPTEEELNDLSKACNKLWELDSNRLVPGKDYQIDCGEGKKVYQKDDMAEGSLFCALNREIFKRPTFARFCSLLDNYNPHVGSKEVVTSQEKQEEVAFIEEISRTAPIKYLHKYLSSKGIIRGSYQDFKSMMTNLWFDLYGRGGSSSSSSAFEHVFVGEIKQQGEQSVSGFHNWLQFYLEEVKGRVDYQGYIYPRRRGQVPDSETQLLTIQFEWNGVTKSVSSTLVGVSPEFEIALYTLCFYMGGENNYVELGPYPVNIKCYRLGNNIGSAFPVAEC
ncbi:uncharacterized protein LOC141666772 [Apium graveolens]|uniref:uncharacterized protein LOC141666772 n=1 Tax=Apium graveolens TaxID=4045 RepID=UPI003D7A7D7A